MADDHKTGHSKNGATRLRASKLPPEDRGNDQAVVIHHSQHHKTESDAGSGSPDSSGSPDNSETIVRYPTQVKADFSRPLPHSPAEDPDTTKPHLQLQYREVAEGSVIRKRFVLEKMLGVGGMGAVFRAKDLIKEEAGDPDPFIAIKLLNGDFREHPLAFVALQREAKKSHQLAHPNIVTCYDFDREGSVVYLTMEMLEGYPLIEVISGKARIFLNTKEKFDVIEQIARGLAYAHKKGIVHSDLKPANLFLTKHGVVKILDFGIARAFNSESYQDSFDVGDLGAFTVAYSSPEMLRRESPHPGDDIYALGIIICELLGNIHPFDRKDAQTALAEKIAPKIPDIANPFLRKLLLNTLAFEKDRRVADATVFLKRFKSAIARPKQILAVVAVSVVLIALNIVYIRSIDQSIDFDSLPQAKQTEFQQLIEEGHRALQFQDLQGAVVNFNSAFLIHRDNKKIKQARERIIAIYKKRKSIVPQEQLIFIEREISGLKQYPLFSEIDGEL